MLLFLPYRTDRTTTRVPIVTCTLAVVNVAVYLASLSDQQGIVASFGLFPAHPSMRTLLTAMFLHTGVLHLAFNMFFLLLFGPDTEDALGRLAYLAFYIGSGCAAGLLNVTAVYALMPSAADVPTIGASGAIAGVLGMYAVRFYWTKIRIFWYVGILFYPLRWGVLSIPAVIGLAVWLALQIAGGLYSVANPLAARVSYWSHIGGMLFGMLLAYTFRLGVEATKEYLMASASAGLDSRMTSSAVRSLHALLDHDPANAVAHADLAKAYALQQDPEHAIPRYEEAVRLLASEDRLDEAVDRYREMKQFYRNARLPAPIEYRIAMHLTDRGEYASALEVFAGVSSSGLPEAEASLMRMGDIHLLKLNDPRSAVVCYERFLSEYPGSAWRAAVLSSLEAARGGSPGDR